MQIGEEVSTNVRSIAPAARRGVRQHTLSDRLGAEGFVTATGPARKESLPPADTPNPLLNEIKLRAKAAGKLVLTPADRRALVRAERLRAVQAEQKPPYDQPWCFFDLAEIRLYLDKPEEVPGLIREGIRHSDHDWHGETFLRSLELLELAGADLPGLGRCFEMLREWKASGAI